MLLIRGDVAPATLLGGHTTFAAQTQRGGHTHGHSEGKQCSAQKFHRVSLSLALSHCSGQLECQGNGDRPCSRCVTSNGDEQARIRRKGWGNAAVAVVLDVVINTCGADYIGEAGGVKVVRIAVEIHPEGEPCASIWQCLNPGGFG